MNSEEERVCYIIPDNFKQGKYIFGRFNKYDLIILIFGSLIGVLLFINLAQLGIQLKNVNLMIGAVIAGVVIVYGCFLLTSIIVPNYHNGLGKLKRYIYFKRHPQIYVWKGVDYYTYEEETEE